jgi:hypothetical protein
LIPTAIVGPTAFVAVSTKVTLPGDPPLRMTTYKVLPSGDTANASGAPPTVMSVKNKFVEALITETVPEPELAT